jgi:hypothetical protein
MIIVHDIFYINIDAIGIWTDKVTPFSNTINIPNTPSL